MSVVLVTGMSGTGKSTVLGEIARRGYATVDADHGDFIDWRTLPGASGPDPLWREDRIEELLEAHDETRHLFVQGTVANQAKFYPRFDAVVLLTAPLDVILARVATRPGKGPVDRERIISDKAEVEPMLLAGATHAIDTVRSLNEVVDLVLAAADG